MTNTQLLYLKSILIGVGSALMMLYAFSYYPGLNPFNDPYQRLIDNTDKLNQKLQSSNIDKNENLESFMTIMREEINDEIYNERKMANAGLRDTLKNITGWKDDLLSILNERIEVMKQYGKPNQETGELERPEYKGENRSYWLGREKRGEKLYQEIQDFYDKLRAIYNSQVVYDSLKIEVRNVSQYPASVWAQESFSHSVVENISVLEGLKFDILEETKMVADLLNSRLGCCCFKIDKIINLSVPYSETAVVGLDFKTRLLPVLNYPKIYPNYSSPDGVLEQEPGEITSLTIPVDGRVIPKGKNEGVQTYGGSLKIHKATGGYETLDFQHQFTVRRPKLFISYLNNQALYRFCANSLKMEVPDLKEHFNPHITAIQADVIPDENEQGLIRLIPNSHETTVKVASYTNGKMIEIGDATYQVIEPPRPKIELLVNGTPYNGYTRISAESKLEVRLIADDFFKANFPQDAHYGVSSIDVIAQPMLGVPMVIHKIKGPEALATSFPLSLDERKLGLLREGVKVFIRVNGIYRKNFAGKAIPDQRFSEIERTISLTIK